ncbi:MAG: hypothetical protein ACYDCN_16300, partial [Bacteroidia bacterium]
LRSEKEKSYRKVLRLCFSLTTLLKNFSPTCCFFSLLSFSMGITHRFYFFIASFLMVSLSASQFKQAKQKLSSCLSTAKALWAFERDSAVS